MRVVRRFARSLAVFLLKAECGFVAKTIHTYRELQRRAARLRICTKEEAELEALVDSWRRGGVHGGPLTGMLID
jgi:hypothetical protein